MTKSIIKHVSHPYASEVWQARKDQAHIEGKPLIERPWWYEDKFGNTWHDLYACLGWPSEVSDKDTGMPGYAAIIGVVRPKTLDPVTHYDPQDAMFVLLDETECKDVPTLLGRCLDLRDKYGYGIQPDLLKMWYGDPDRFNTTLGLFNERQLRGGKEPITIAPSDDYYTPLIFDNYVRSLQSCLLQGKERLVFWDGKEILRKRIDEFLRDDPAVLAAGGLVHSLLNRCMWMSTADGATCFSVEEAVG